MPMNGISAPYNKDRKKEDLQVDEVLIEIDGVVMKMVRRSTLSVPAEVSAVIPRVEIRKRSFENGQLASEYEMVLNSITIVHAPCHPPAGENPPGGEEKEEKVPVLLRVTVPGDKDGEEIGENKEELRIRDRRQKTYCITHKGAPANNTPTGLDGTPAINITLPKIIINGRSICPVNT